MKSPTLPMVSIAVVTILGLVTAAKLPSLRGANHIEKSTLNPERKYGSNSFRKRDWLKISQSPPNIVHTSMGERLELECEVIGSPPPTIQWIRGSNPSLNDDFESNHILDNIRSSTGLAKVKSRLIIDCVMPEHEGLYSCVATTGGKTNVSPPAMLLIQGNHLNNITALLSACPSIANSHVEHAPHILQWSPVVMQNIGDDAILPCRASGNPAPTVYWMDGNEDMVPENDARFKILPNGDLMIFKLHWGDMGGYTCVATNSRGRDSITSFIYPFSAESESSGSANVSSNLLPWLSTLAYLLICSHAASSGRDS